jgi:lipopolysaccharide assembly outer membrane protein LptD (OstA)
MENRPTMYLNYPDSARMVEVIGDRIEYDAATEIAQAGGNVKITSTEMVSESGCAIMNRKANVLDLSQSPVAKRKQSVISGELISVYMNAEAIERIDVIDSARGEFNEPIDSSTTDFDRSVLTGNRIIFDFAFGQLYQVTCWGQAYSWYYPSSRGKPEFTENSVSGDTILFSVLDERLQEVDVIGGAVGSYRHGEDKTVDSSVVQVVDTINYDGRYINYNLADSLITLEVGSHVQSASVELDAYEIQLETDNKMIRAYSAELLSDSLGPDRIRPYTAQFQPNPIPVQLKDGDELLLGDYLEYSIDTEKGRIFKSKSAYETGFYYGNRVFRSTKNIFYVEQGRYTTCDADEPHFHFYSSNMKLIEDDKLIAKPVVFYLGRLPLLALPYYVFPLKKGRHSGVLPFTFGNFEQGDRYISNLGYYWAASEYWDWQGAFDYFERARTIKLSGQLRWAKRYAYSGNVQVNYARETSYSQAFSATNLGGEAERLRWAFNGAHTHEVTPSFKFSASGQYQSDKTYYNDFSVNLEDRLNRNTRSQVTFVKRFSKSVSLSGSATHDVNLDTETRTDQFPRLNLGLPAWHPFGTGRLDENGQLQSSWYNQFVVTYRPDLINFSSRITIDSLFPPVYQVDTIPDTVFADDSTIVSIEDVIDSTLVSQDTLSHRSRKEYTRVNHGATLQAPIKIARFINFNPSLTYSETWFKVYETDQSQTAGIETDNTYRTYAYRFASSASTNLYGTIYPNLAGLVGLRQVITPQVTYSYAPESNRHPEVRAFAGGGAGTARTSSAMAVSVSHVYQAKVRRGETEKNLELVTFSHSFSYDFEQDERKFSNLSTSFRSSVLPNISFYGSMTHSLYKPGTNDLSFFSPYLEGFQFSTSFSLAGSRSIFDEAGAPDPGPGQGVDSASQLANPTAPSAASPGTGKGWNLSVSYDFEQSGKGTAFRKQAFAKMNLRFWLTPTTSVNYSQYYDFARHKTINSQINIVKSLHCWTGTFFWVPTGSNRGYGFRLYVTAIPSLKFENSQNPLSSSYFQSLQ